MHANNTIAIMGRLNILLGRNRNKNSKNLKKKQLGV